ncbi:MAG: VWA domain-containing protein [Nitrospirae bacterium]|nr:VWA domain-containing protein [Nitrospirota bacterium]
MGSFIGIVLKGAMLLLFLLALLGVDPEVPREWAAGKRVCTLFVLDLSESIPPAAAEYAQRLVLGYMERMGGRDRAGLVVFGKEPRVAWFGAEDGVRWPGDRLPPGTDGTETHIAGALRLAASLFPEGYERHVVLFSDGRETGGGGELEKTAARLAEEGIILHGVPLGGRGTGLFLKNLHLPETVHPGSPFPVRVVVGGPGTGEVRLYRNGTLLARETVRKEDPAPEEFSFSFREKESGYVRYEVALHGMPEGGSPVQRLGKVVRSEGPLRVLYVGGTALENDGVPPLASFLRGRGFPVTWIPGDARNAAFFFPGMSMTWGGAS